MLVAFYMPRTCTLLSALSHSAFIVTLSLSPSPQWSKAVPPPSHYYGPRLSVEVLRCTCRHMHRSVARMRSRRSTPRSLTTQASCVRFGPHHACQLPRGRRRTTVPPPCASSRTSHDSLKLYYGPTVPTAHVPHPLVWLGLKKNPSHGFLARL